MTDLAGRLMALFPFNKASLAGRVPDPKDPGLTPSTIPRRGETGPAPLSFAQQQLWFLEQLELNSSLCNVHAAFRVHGALDQGAVQAVFAGYAVSRARRVVNTKVGSSRMRKSPQYRCACGVVFEDAER